MWDIRATMHMGPRTEAKFLKLVELNADVLQDPNFTVHIYSKDSKDIEFVHNVNYWDPTTQLSPQERGVLQHFLQLTVMRYFYMSNFISIYPNFKLSVQLLKFQSKILSICPTF